MIAAAFTNILFLAAQNQGIVLQRMSASFKEVDFLRLSNRAVWFPQICGKKAEFSKHDFSCASTLVCL